MILLDISLFYISNENCNQNGNAVRKCYQRRKQRESTGTTFILEFLILPFFNRCFGCYNLKYLLSSNKMVALLQNLTPSYYIRYILLHFLLFKVTRNLILQIRSIWRKRNANKLYGQEN